MPLRGLQPRSCSTPALASARLIGRLYTGQRPSDVPLSGETPPQTNRNQHIRERHAAGETISDLAREFGISPQRMSQIVRGKRK